MTRSTRVRATRIPSRIRSRAGPCDLRCGTGTRARWSESPTSSCDVLCGDSSPRRAGLAPSRCGVPAPAARRAPSASGPDTPAGCRNNAPSPRRSTRSSSRHRQREALLAVRARSRSISTDRHSPMDASASSTSATGSRAFKPSLRGRHGSLPPRVEPVDLHARLTGQRLQRFATL